jgi:threonine aldolase
MGGGWRQAGFLAAAGIYALDNNIIRLKEDHNRAGTLYNIIKDLDYVEEIMPQETNILIFKLKKDKNQIDFINYLGDKGIKVSPFGKDNIRIVTHLDITDEMLLVTERAFQER